VVLCAFAFVLPLVEAPKNILLALLPITLALRAPSTLRRLAARPAMAGALAAVVVAAAISTIANWPVPRGWSGTMLMLSAAVVGFAALSNPLARARWPWILGSTIAGASAGLAYGLWEAATGAAKYVELNSVGVVTHSAIYLAICTLAAWGVLSQLRSAASPDPLRILGAWALVGAMLVGLVLMGSRAALLALLAAMFVLFLMRPRDRVWPVLAAAVLVAAAIAISLPDRFNQQRMWDKLAQMVGGESPTQADTIRRAYWRIAWAQLTQGGHWRFGIGPRSFASIRPDQLHFDPPLPEVALPLAHAHNMYLHKLVEEGPLGLAALLAVFAVPAAALARQARAARRDGRSLPALWYAGFGAVVIPAVCGLVQTPWYHEHSLLESMLLSLVVATGDPAGSPGG